MKINTFHGTGAEGIERSQNEANAWLKANQTVAVINTSASMCSIGGSSEIYQSYVITIFYEPPKK